MKKRILWTLPLVQVVTMVTTVMIIPSTGLAEGSVPEQRVYYEQAAKDSKKASKNQQMLVPVWGVVSGVCFASCAGWIDGGSACDVANWSGTAIDVGVSYATSQEFGDALQSLAMTAGTQFVSAFLTGAGSQIFGSTIQSTSTDALMSQKSYSCVVGAFAALRALYKQYESGKYKDEADKYSDMAKKFDSKGQSVIGNLNLSPNQGAGVVAQGRSTLIPGQPQGELAGGSAFNEDFCNEALNIGNGNGILNCATALDSTLPKGILSPNFSDQFKKLSGGADLGEFIKNAENSGLSGGQVLGGLTSGGDLSKANAFASSFEKMLKDGMGIKNYDSSGSTYAGAGGSGRSSSSKSDGGNALAGLFGGAQGAGARSPSSNAPLKFGKSFDEIFSDRSLNIFTRVSQRYNHSKDRIEDLPYASGFNRATRLRK